MAEMEFGDRTLPPTERRRRAARMRGEVAHSQQVTSCATFIGAGCVIWFVAPSIAHLLAKFLKQRLTAPAPVSFQVTDVERLSREATGAAVTVLWPIAAVIVICAIVACLVQTGWLWIPIDIRFRRTQNQIVSGARSVESIFGLVRLSVLLAITYQFFINRMHQIGRTGLGEPITMLVQPATIAADFCLQVCLCLVAFALLDYAARYWRQEQRLKMTIEERRREQQDEDANRRIQRRIGLRK